MKKIFLILIVSALLTACSSASSNNTGSSRRTPVAQIPVQSTSQPPATAQPSVTDTSTPTPVPTGTPTSASSVTVTPTPTIDPSQPAGLDVLSHQGYSMNDGFYSIACATPPNSITSPTRPIPPLTPAAPSAVSLATTVAASMGYSAAKPLTMWNRSRSCSTTGRA